MKLTVKKIIAPVIAGLMLFVAAPLNSNAVTQNVLSYKVSNGQATIVYCVKSVNGKLTIPDTLGGFPVTSIGNQAFEFCDGLTNITVPASVKSIGDGAFVWCDGLKSIYINSGNPAYTSENGVLFNKTKTELIQYPASKTGLSYTIPLSVTSIEKRSFYGCKGLTNITIPNSVTNIGNSAFSECFKLKGVNIPDSVTNIGDEAFSDTAWYNKQPDGLIYAGKVAYGYKGDIPENTAIVLSSDTKGVASGAFHGCTGLTSITIPASVMNIADYAFQECYAQIIYVDTGNPNYASENGVLFNKSKSELIQCLAGRTDSSYTIPNSVKSIGNNAFEYCSALKTVKISDRVTSIRDYAFSECAGLTSITIPNSVKSIGDGIFFATTSLTSINVSKANKVYASENGVLFNHSKQELICYPEGKTGDYTIPNSVKSIGNYAFYNCEGLKSVNIPNSITSIGDSAFDGCSELTSITIPNSVTSIGDSALTSTAWYYNQPDGLIYAGKVAYGYKGEMPENTAIVLKPGTKGIAGGAFQPKSEEAENTGLTGVSIPNTVTNIGYRAFCSCTGLKSITIPKSVVSIGEQAIGYYLGLDYAEKIPGVTINCFANSAGLKYAGENGFTYKILPASAPTDPTTTVPVTTTVNGATSTTTATSTDGSGISSKVNVPAVILISVVFLALAVTAVFIITKKKKK